MPKKYEDLQDQAKTIIREAMDALYQTLGTVNCSEMRYVRDGIRVMARRKVTGKAKPFERLSDSAQNTLRSNCSVIVSSLRGFDSTKDPLTTTSGDYAIAIGPAPASSGNLEGDETELMKRIVAEAKESVAANAS